MKHINNKIILFVSVIIIAACAPEVGSEQWCKDMKDKPKGDWTMTEAKYFAKHCVF